MKSIEILGENGERAVIEDLQRTGILLQENDLTLEKLSHGLNLVLGLEAARLVMERVFLNLDEMYTMGSRTE